MTRLLSVLFSGWLALGPGQHFDPSHDLPEYDACTFSKYADLYQLEHFQSLAGKDLTAAQLEEVHRAWDAERSRASAEIQKLESDPTTRAAWDLRKGVKAHRFFATIPFEMRVRGDVVLFIQQPAKPADGYVDLEERKFGVPAAAVVRRFVETYAAPLEVQRQKAVPLTAVFVLASRKAFDDFGRSLPSKVPFVDSVMACYDSSSHLVVTFESGGTNADVEKDEQRRWVHMVAVATLDAYSSTGMSAAGAAWLVTGFSSVLARPDAGAGEVDPDVVRHCASMLKGQRAGCLLFPAMSDLLAASNAKDIVRPIKERLDVEAVPFSQNTANAIVAIFDDASYLLVRFLLDAEGGRYRAGFLRYLKAALSGKPGVDAFLQSLGEDSSGALEKNFRADVVARLGKEGVTVRSDSPSFAPAPLTVSAPASLPPIVVPPPSRAVQVGAALERARGGDVLGALADARQAGADPDDIAFLESLAKLSDDVLEAERKADRNLPVKGKTPAVGKVARFDANSLVLADAKGKEIVLPRSAFGPDQVLDRVRSKQLDVGNPEILASTMALVGRSIADASPKVRDRAARWAATTRELDARNRVARLAPVVTTPPADVAPCLEDIDALLGTLRDTESVRANPTGLAALGTRLLETSYAQSDDVLGAFKGKAKRLPDGRVEVKFDDASSLAGFVEDKGYGERLLRGAYGIEGRDKHLGETSVAAGTLVLDGADAVFHPIGFSAPCTIEFELNMIATRDPSFPNLYFQAIAFDDSRGAWCGYNWAAAVVSPGEHRVVQDSDEDDRNARSFEYDFLYRFKLDHDGKSLSLLVNGVSKGTIPNASVKCGRVGFVVCGPARYQISKLVVRGMVDVSTLTERRAAWVARRTAKWQGDAKH